MTDSPSMTYMTALSLANMKLPGFPGSKRKFNAYLKRNSVPYRRRRARGGGREYAFNDLPEQLQKAILKYESLLIQGEVLGDYEGIVEQIREPEIIRLQTLKKKINERLKILKRERTK